MKVNIPYTYEYQGNSELTLIETEEGDIIIEVARDSEGVFEEEHFDVKVFAKGPMQIELEVHEGGYTLSQSEEFTIRSMVREYQNRKCSISI